MSKIPPRMQISAKPSEDGQDVVIQIDMNGEPLGHVILDGATAERHAHLVGQVRSMLPDQVALDLDPGARLEVQRGIRAAAFHTDNAVVLALRHPGLGWMGFHLEPQQAQELAGALLAPQTPASRGS